MSDRRAKRVRAAPLPDISNSPLPSPSSTPSSSSSSSLAMPTRLSKRPIVKKKTKAKKKFVPKKRAKSIPKRSVDSFTLALDTALTHSISYHAIVNTAAKNDSSMVTRSKSRTSTSATSKARTTKLNAAKKTSSSSPPPPPVSRPSTNKRKMPPVHSNERRKKKKLEQAQKIAYKQEESDEKEKADIEEQDDPEVIVVEKIISPVKSTKKKAAAQESGETDTCPICMDAFEEPKTLSICSHVFCTGCIDHYFEKVKPQCPCCFVAYGEIRGDQPSNGTMQVHKTSSHRLPGFETTSKGIIRIDYNFPDGIQEENHPHPGMPFHGTHRTAYLPDNAEGKKVLKLLQRAFELQHTFTVGQSRTTGRDDVVTWNDIHHKTSTHGGVECFGYPDSTYLNRVQEELAAKGIK